MIQEIRRTSILLFDKSVTVKRRGILKKEAQLSKFFCAIYRQIRVSGWLKHLFQFVTS